MKTPTNIKEVAEIVQSEGFSVVASISGGKDSAAMALWLREHDVEHSRVMMDTGWEHPMTYHHALSAADAVNCIAELPDYNQEDADRLMAEYNQKYGVEPTVSVIGDVKRLTPQTQMVELVKKKQMFPGRLNRFCTEELKSNIIKSHLEEIDDPINTIGIRRDESRNRKDAEMFEWSDYLDCWVWRPLCEWEVDDVVAIHHRHGLKPNPLYLMGAKRVGCWPCIHASKDELRLISDVDPNRISVIRELEKGLSHKAKPPTFFHASKKCENCNGRGEIRFAGCERFDSSLKSCNHCKGRGRIGTNSTVDKMVSWSHTSRGSKQFTLFNLDQMREGCLRWGMCEA